VRGWVFKFVARYAAERVVAALERKQRVGLVLITGPDPLDWKPINALNALRDVSLPTDRTPRVLLFVHGTFSSTLGSFGGLGATVWGKALLADALSRYDAVIGFDHRTLSDDPLQNATQLLDRIEDSDLGALDADAVAFSRGGLVLRSLIEYLLPGARVRLRVRRAIFVAATNSGTELASSKNWNRLIDLSTNLVAAGSRAIALFAPPAALATTITNHAIGSIGALVKALAAQLLDEGHVPGLSAMVPDGQFIREINRTQPGQPAAADSMYFAITSDFDVGRVDGNTELPPGLVTWLADTIVDAAMGKAPNDLVVHNKSTLTIDPGSGAFIKDHRHFDSNPHVYHTVFFTRKEVADVIRQWFGFDTPIAATSRASLPRDAETSIVVIDTREPFSKVAPIITRRLPEYVVARRLAGSHVFHYAFRPEELLSVFAGDAGRMNMPLEVALQDTAIRLGEDSSSDELNNGQRRGPYGNRGPTTQRTVVIQSSAVTGVLDPGPRATIDLRDLHVSASPPRDLPVSASPPDWSSERTEVFPVPGAHIRFPTAASRGVRRPVPPRRDVIPEEPFPGRHTEEMAVPTGSRNGGDSPPQKVKVYASAETPEKIQVGTSADLLVTVSRDEIIVAMGPSRASGSASVAPDKPLLLQVIPKVNLEVVGDARVDVDPSQAKSEFAFELRGAAVGAAEVWVLLRQGVQVLLKLILKPTVVKQAPQRSTRPARDSGSAEEGAPDDREFPVLQIFENEIGGKVRYQFILQMSAREHYADYSAPLQGSRDDYVAKLYEKIENFWQSKPGDVPAFMSELRAFGGTLFDALVPAGIQQPLWDARDRLTAIQVLAEEPFIPWELVHLKEPARPGRRTNTLPAESHFLGQKGLVRWLHNRGTMPPSVRIRRQRSHYVIPTYPAGDYELPAAQEEIPFLKKVLGSEAVAPIDATTIQSLLQRPEVDHFHYSGHGEADTKNAALDAHLLLSLDKEGGQYVPRYLSSTVIGQTAALEQADGNRPLVVLNACQIGRAGWHLTSIGGFAEAFISRGAGIFVGSLWSVGDEPARTFSEAFYQALIEQQRPLAEAATFGREEARKAGDATWIAYVVYGYPYATVARE
jgi:hypothetical protein